MANVVGNVALVLGVMLVIAFMVGCIAVTAWAIIDAVGRTDAEWAAIGQNKFLWLTFLIGGFILGGFLGVILSIAYLVTIRRRFQEAAAASARLSAEAPS